jgi:hypothetical protein
MDKIWYQDVNSLFATNNIPKFIPTAAMSTTEQLNALVRFSVYFSVIIFAVRHDTRIFFLPIGIGILSYVIHEIMQRQALNQRELFRKFGIQTFKNNKEKDDSCTVPSENNPFMNVLINEYAENPSRRPACKYNIVKKKVDENFNKNLYRNVGDIFSKNASDRQYYTMPSTTIPNDQERFANWLYKTPTTCKEGNGEECYRQVPRTVNI